MNDDERLGQWLRESGTVVSRERYIRRWLYSERVADHETEPDLYHETEARAYGHCAPAGALRVQGDQAD